MKIMQLVADGRPGGGTTFVLALLEGLCRDALVENSLICQRGSYLSQRATEMGITVFELDFFRNRLDPRVPKQLSRILKSIHPDVVHVHGGRAGFFLSFVPKSIPKLNVIYTVHGYHFAHKNWMGKVLGALAEAWVSRRVDCTVFVSNYDYVLCPTLADFT